MLMILFIISSVFNSVNRWFLTNLRQSIYYVKYVILIIAARYRENREQVTHLVLF